MATTTRGGAKRRRLRFGCLSAFSVMAVGLFGFHSSDYFPRRIDSLSSFRLAPTSVLQEPKTRNTTTTIQSAVGDPSDQISVTSNETEIIEDSSGGKAEKTTSGNGNQGSSGTESSADTATPLPASKTAATEANDREEQVSGVKTTEPLAATDNQVNTTTDDAGSVNTSSKPVSDATIIADQQAYYRSLPPWPRWGPEGINMELLLQFIFALEKRQAFTVEDRTRRLMFHETLYVIGKDGVWISHELQTRGKYGYTHTRSIPSELSMKRAFQILKRDYNATDGQKQRWPRLAQVLFGERSAGFPFVAWYGDFSSCNYLNWNNTHSIPVFTVCAAMNCSYAFPAPTYRNLERSASNEQDWKLIMSSDYNQNYPWSTKIRKVVWRGALSGSLHDHDSPRTKLARFAAACCRGNETDAMPPLDIGLSRIPEVRLRREKAPASVRTKLGGILEPISPQADFQKYVGILDTDGNSWSSRFASLLCYNSVILKVEPEHVDHFYHFVGHEEPVLPWKHFIPVKADLSDLIEKAEMVADPENDPFLQQIIRTANSWCEKHMVLSALDRDYLDVWEAYVKQLDRANPNWSETWEAAKQRIFKDNSPFRMSKSTLGNLANWESAAKGRKVVNGAAE